MVPVADEWAFARTSSAGKQTIHAIKKTTDEANQASVGYGHVHLRLHVMPGCGLRGFPRCGYLY